MAEIDAQEVRSAVHKRYRALALAAQEPSAEGGSCCGPRLPQSASGAPRRQRAVALYGDKVMALPETVLDAVAGCGNPVALAELRPGEVVADLGSGGGIDVFLAAQEVGPQGRVIGVDMTPEMIALARANAQQVGASNVEFRLGEMEHLPVATASVDVVISNCVINLAPDKDAVFREAYRVLKPGGRLAISDVVLERDLPEEVKGNAELWAGCVAGALLEEEYLAKIRSAGFQEVTVSARTPSPRFSQGVCSIKVRAHKP